MNNNGITAAMISDGEGNRPMVMEKQTATNEIGGWVISRGSVIAQQLAVGSGAVHWSSGTGNPEGVVSGAVGALFSRTDGGVGTVLYVKESGEYGPTGWVAK